MQRFGKKQKLLALSALTFTPAVSYAALPTEVSTAIGAAVTDIAAAGALIMGVIIAIKVVKWVIRVF